MKRLLVIAVLITVAVAALPDIVHGKGLVDSVLPADPSSLGKDDVTRVLIYIIRWLLLFSSAIAMIFIVVSGYQYILAAGNPEKLEKAKMGLTWSIGGFVLIVSSYAIVLLTQETFGATQKVTPLGGQPTEAATVIENLATLIFVFAGATAVIFLILGGYRYITSQGNQELAEKAKHTILYAVIGLAAVMLAVALYSLTAEVVTGK
jgi:type IV secretion system pilin